MFNPLDERLNDLYREEMRRKAARKRLAGESRRRGRPVFVLRMYRPVLNQLGHWLVLSGTRLQRRYGDMYETAPMQQNRPAHSGNI